MTISAERPPLRPRTPGVDLDSPIPRHWFGGNAVATHVANGLHLLFPAGERFFVRSVRHFADRIGDPALREQIRGFSGQEGRHAHEHSRVTRLLEADGFEVKRFHRLYDAVAFGAIERLSPPELRLAVTAACEHFTALIAEAGLRTDQLDDAHPAMRALLSWHGAEEIEHRSVAFDVLQKVSRSYTLRIAGLAVATTMLCSFWWLAAAMLLWQDDQVDLARLRRDWIAFRDRPGEGAAILRGIRQYMRPGFHPSQNDIDHLAIEYLAAAGLA